MSSRNSIFDTYGQYFIGFANLNGRGEVQVEHYWADGFYDCMKQCLEAHDIYVHPDVNTEQGLRTLAEHNNFLISEPRKVKITII